MDDSDDWCFKHSHLVLSEALVARLTGGDQFSALRQKFRQEDERMEAQLACIDESHTRRHELSTQDFEKTFERVSAMISGVEPPVCQCQRRQLMKSLSLPARKRDPLCHRWPVQRFYACVRAAQRRLLQNPRCAP